MNKRLSNKASAWLIFLVTGAIFLACHKESHQSSALGPIHISPDTGLASVLVTITGSGFDTVAANDRVTFNGKPAVVQSASPTSLIVTAPDTTSGPVSVAIGSQHVTGPLFQYQTMTVDTVMPTQGPAGTRVTITGSGMQYTGASQDLQPAVTFNGHPATVISYSPTQLLVAVPDSAGNGPLVVSLGNLHAGIPNFYFLGVNAVSPRTGNAGTIATITGGFGPDLSHISVSIGGVAATIDSINSSRIVVTIPPGSGAGKVSVSINGLAVYGPAFTYVPPPTISYFIPTSGPVGTTVTLTGTVFSAVPAENIVTFNGTAAPVTQASATQLTVTVPAGTTTGPVVVNVNGQKTTGPIYTVQSLGISNVNPSGAPPGTAVTITGTGFNPSATQDQVSFNGTMATVTSASATQLIVTTPAGFTAGTLSVMTGGLTAIWPLPFKPSGVVTYAGGSLNPNQFKVPAGLAFDAAGNLYVADQAANNIQKIAPNGTVTNFAGDPGGKAGAVDGQGANALFNQPEGLAIDQQGNLYVADFNNGTIRKIAPDATVSTFVSSGTVVNPWGIAMDAGGNVYVSDYGTSHPTGPVYEFSSTGTLINTSQVNDGPVPCYPNLESLTVDGSGNFYVIDYDCDGIFQNVNPWFSGFSQSSNKGLCLDNGGNLIIADGGYNQIDLLNPQTMSLSVITGGGGPNLTNSGYQDGNLPTALFNNPSFVVVDANGYIYVSDQGNSAIRKIAQ